MTRQARSRLSSQTLGLININVAKRYFVTAAPLVGVAVVRSYLAHIPNPARSRNGLDAQWLAFFAGAASSWSKWMIALNSSG